jgi:hypothetical protein
MVNAGSKVAVASRTEDLASFQLVESLWELRCSALSGGGPSPASATLDLTEGDSSLVARRSRLLGVGRGVEAHGSNATLSK